MTSRPEAVGADSTAHPHEALARQALAEVTDAAAIGDFVDAVAVTDGVEELRFETTLPGYPGWRWTVAVAALDSAAPTVLEVELLPGDDALLAPAWVPWAERLAEYRRTHPSADEIELVVDSDEIDDLDEDELDEDIDDVADLDDVLDVDDEDEDDVELDGDELDGDELDTDDLDPDEVETDEDEVETDDLDSDGFGADDDDDDDDDLDEERDDGDRR